MLTDSQINELLSEKKLLAPDYQEQLRLKLKRGHQERELEIIGEKDSGFIIILRLNQINPLDFSAILAYSIPRTTTHFRLRRYNGKHEHTNKIEQQTFYNFHIHTATERYQLLGQEEDAFAEPTDRYNDLSGAIKCLVEDCGFIVPPGTQLELI